MTGLEPPPLSHPVQVNLNVLRCTLYLCLFCVSPYKQATAIPVVLKRRGSPRHGVNSNQVEAVQAGLSKGKQIRGQDCQHLRLIMEKARKFPERHLPLLH